MKLTPAILSRVVTLFLALSLASCALPPEAAWRVIKTDGLLPLIAMEIGVRPYPRDLAMYSRRPTTPLPITARPVPSNNYIGSVYDRPAPVLPPRPVIRTEEYRVTPLPARPDAIVGTANREQSSPRPPRPNLITKGRNDDSGPKVVIEPKPDHTPPVIATVKPKPEAEPEAKPQSEPEAKPTPEPKKELATTPAPSMPFTPAAQPPVRAIEDSLPYGIAIAGRPGLVNSPYAAKNQFVDVAGLKPGQEVKCPYSGKLFRVPVGAQASGPKASEEDKKQ